VLFGRLEREGESLGIERSGSKSIISALDVLGPVSKQRLVKHLKRAYGVNIWYVTPSSLDELKNALEDVFGESVASELMKLIYVEISKVEE
jgi:hypothetical protein